MEKGAFYRSLAVASHSSALTCRLLWCCTITSCNAQIPWWRNLLTMTHMHKHTHTRCTLTPHTHFLFIQNRAEDRWKYNNLGGDWKKKKNLVLISADPCLIILSHWMPIASLCDTFISISKLYYQKVLKPQLFTVIEGIYKCLNYRKRYLNDVIRSRFSYMLTQAQGRTAAPPTCWLLFARGDQS